MAKVNYTTIVPLQSKSLEDNDTALIYFVGNVYHLVKQYYQPGSWYFGEEASFTSKRIRTVDTEQKALNWLNKQQ